MSATDGKVCANCRSWEAYRCHYNPPGPNGEWPRTVENDWCGQWEPEAPARRREREAADELEGLS